MAEILDFKCPCCNAPINFDSTEQMMKCPYCDSQFDVAALKGKDDVLNSQPADEFNWQTNAEEDWGNDEQNDLSVFVATGSIPLYILTVSRSKMGQAESDHQRPTRHAGDG